MLGKIVRAAYNQLAREGKVSEEKLLGKVRSLWYEWRNWQIMEWADRMESYMVKPDYVDFLKLTDALFMKGVNWQESPEPGHERYWFAWAISCLCMATSMWGMDPPESVEKAVQKECEARSGYEHVVTKSGLVADQAKMF